MGCQEREADAPLLPIVAPWSEKMGAGTVGDRTNGLGLLLSGTAWPTPGAQQTITPATAIGAASQPVLNHCILRSRRVVTTARPGFYAVVRVHTCWLSIPNGPPMSCE